MHKQQVPIQISLKDERLPDKNRELVKGERWAQSLTVTMI